MDIKKFRKDLALSQSELAQLFDCAQGHISNIENGTRSLTGLQLRLLIEKYGLDVISRYAEPEELPATVTINMPKVQTNQGQINGGGGNTMTVDTTLLDIVKESQRQNAISQEQVSKAQEQIDRLIALLEKKY